MTRGTVRELCKALDSPIKKIYIDMEKRVGGDTSAGGDAHVHKLPPSFFKYDNVGCYTTDSDTEDEKPSELDYPSSSNDASIGFVQGAGVEDGIGGTKNCGVAGRAASANVVGQLYAHILSSGANICPKDIMRDMREKHGVELLYTKAWMAMQHAWSTVYGKVDEPYQFLPSYFHMLAEANPGTVTAIDMDEHNRFLYAFLSFRQSL
ncbi:hypothetical protein Ddye_005132 [Dipteronia dyeriana]|uniref:Uncharacterized protein n=1 Tax=Dipteronia dyeriana TaxID=168575 RepID=A0AAE0CPG5_9ROSI|nr:hypothetical protein Ddye_005132 [Dipteronia dyeriana]